MSPVRMISLKAKREIAGSYHLYAHSRMKSNSAKRIKVKTAFYIKMLFFTYIPVKFKFMPNFSNLILEAKFNKI